MESPISLKMVAIVNSLQKRITRITRAKPGRVKDHIPITVEKESNKYLPYRHGFGLIINRNSSIGAMSNVKCEDVGSDSVSEFSVFQHSDIQKFENYIGSEFLTSWL
jgi:hypothetical protein